MKKATVCTRIKLRRVPTSLFSIQLGILVPGPPIEDRGICGSPLFTDGEKKGQICERCVRPVTASI